MRRKRKRQNVGVLDHKEYERSSERGFTMAELLIVVAIVAVLVAIAIPVFSSQLRNSRLAVDHAAMRDAYALMQVANNTQEVEIEGVTYSFEKLKELADGSTDFKNFYLTEDCSGFVFQGSATQIALPQGAYVFKETGFDETTRDPCETCSQLKYGAHYKGGGIILTLNRAENRIVFAI